MNRTFILNPHLTVDLEALEAFCRAHRIQWLAVFGSALRGDFGDESDVDVLVEFEHGATPGLEFFTLDEEISPMFGDRRIDLGTRKGINRWIRDRVLQEAVVLYDAA